MEIDGDPTGTGDWQHFTGGEQHKVVGKCWQAKEALQLQLTRLSNLKVGAGDILGL